jgi:Ca2+/Na+ antiporter
MATREYRSRRPGLVLLLLSAPYIFTVLLTGELRELRLLMPLLLCLVFVYVQLTRHRDTTAALEVSVV